MTGATPLISVIVPAYNAEESLARTLASISRQTYRNIEIIVQDDGSIDATREIAAAAARDDDRIRCFSGPNVGLAGARNAAAARAAGDALAPCDADDLWHPQKLERQVAALYGAPDDTGVAYCWSDGIDDDDAVIFPDWKCATAEGDVFHEMVADSLPGSGSVPLIRRKYFDAAGGYPAGTGSTDDWHLYIALAAICKWVVIPERLVAYRIGTRNVSRDYEFMERTLGGDTRWIVETWPDLPRAVLRRRAHTINCYLAFLATRRGDILRALRYRLRAVAARPADLVSMSWLGFHYMWITRLLGFERYYWPFWRAPSPWPGAVTPQGGPDAGASAPASRPIPAPSDRGS